MSSPDSEFTAEVLRASRLLHLGRPIEADRALEVASKVATTDLHVAEAAVVRASVRFWNLADVDGAHDVLDEAIARLGDGLAGDAVAVQRALTFLYVGRSPEAVALAGELRDRGRLDPVSQLKCRVVDMVTQGMAGHEVAVDVDGLGPELDGDELAVFYLGLFGGAICLARGMVGVDPAVDGGAPPASRARSVMEDACEGTGLIVDGTNLLWSGRPRSAVACLEEATAQLRGRGDRLRMLALGLGQLAYGRALLGDVAGATSAAQEAEATSHPLCRFDELFVGRGRAWAAAARGEVSAARDLLAATARSCEQLHQPVLAAQAWHDVARLGDARVAAAQLQRLVEPAAGDGLVASLAAHASALLAEDADGLAAASLDARQRGHLLHAAEAAAQAASVYGGVRRGEADRWRAVADELAVECEGAHTPGLARRHDVDLTAREREVVGLAARGHSSPDIARRLNLSVRTVGNHLQAAYGKLGVHRREDLAHLAPFATDR